VEPGWWKRPPEAFQEQVEKLCPRCGMCLPMGRQHLIEKQEKFSPRLFADFRKRGAIRMEKEKHIVMFDAAFSRAEIVAMADDWHPTNFRDDQKSDQALGAWEKGMLACLAPNPSDPMILHPADEKAYNQALAGLRLLGLDEKPRTWRFWYKDMAFDPFREPYPFVLPGHEEENRLYRRIMLLHFRQLLDDAAFAALEAEPITPEYLVGLAQRYKNLLKKWHEKEMEHLGYFFAGRDVYFAGYGVAWKRFKKYFAKVRPRCFIAGMDGNSLPSNVSFMDGIPVKHVDILLREHAEPLPFVIFCKSGQAEAWHEKVSIQYRDLVQGENIHLITLTPRI
jgi:hypothetical protein